MSQYRIKMARYFVSIVMDMRFPAYFNPIQSIVKCFTITLIAKRISIYLLRISTIGNKMGLLRKKKLHNIFFTSTNVVVTWNIELQLCSHHLHSLVAFVFFFTRNSILSLIKSFSHEAYRYIPLICCI